jgi:hypothetical protein
MPDAVKLSSPGRAFASAIRSFTVLTGSEGVTTMVVVMVCNKVMGTKSFTGS